MFDENMSLKLTLPEFLDDTEKYLRKGTSFDSVASWEMIKARLFGRNKGTAFIPCPLMNWKSGRDSNPCIGVADRNLNHSDTGL